jgi:hypothetical protein
MSQFAQRGNAGDEQRVSFVEVLIGSLLLSAYMFLPQTVSG